jgi:hypothetical protein
MCEYDCVDFKFEGYVLEGIVMMRGLDQFPSLRLGHLIIKMYLDIVSCNYQILFNPSYHATGHSN